VRVTVGDVAHDMTLDGALTQLKEELIHA
jgi:hypothetical protein